MYNSPIRNNKLLQEAFLKGYRAGLQEQSPTTGTPAPQYGAATPQASSGRDKPRGTARAGDPNPGPNWGDCPDFLDNCDGWDYNNPCNSEGFNCQPCNDFGCSLCYEGAGAWGGAGGCEATLMCDENYENCYWAWSSPGGKKPGGGQGAPGRGFGV